MIAGFFIGLLLGLIIVSWKYANTVKGKILFRFSPITSVIPSMYSMRFLLFVFLVISIIQSCSNSAEEITPLPPSNLIANAVSTSQINLSWIDNSTNETGFKIERKLGTETYSVIATTSVDISNYSDENLPANTTYSYRLYSFNSTGKSATYSNEVIITTNSVPILTTTPISLITASTASSGGIISSNGGSLIISKGVVWGTNPDPTKSLSTKTEDGSGSESFTSGITGLSWDKKYYVRAYATNSTGTGYGDELTFNTIPLSINTSSMSEIGAFTASSGGTISGNVGESVFERGVVWSLTPNPTVALSTKTIDGSGKGNFTSKLTGLSPSTTYYVRAYATGDTNAAYGNEFSFTTNQSLYQAGSGVVDGEGNSYATIILGDHEWMQENLRTTKFSNGDPIPNIINASDWENLTTGAWLYYNNDSQFNITYGKIYNSYTVTDSRNVCPASWHVPTEADWRGLTDYLGGQDISANEIGKAGGQMKSIGTQHWFSPNVGATNESGFTGLPSGYYKNNGYHYMGMICFWWCSTTKIIGNVENYPTFALYYNEGFGIAPTSVGTLNFAKNSGFGFSIRCIKD